MLTAAINSPERRGSNMAATNITGESPRLIDAIEDAETTSLEAVRKFVDTVNDSIPDLGGGEDGPRRKIIDAAFKMTEHLVGASNRVAQSMLDITEKHLNDADKKAKASTK
jgi:hypothetical protein